MFRRIDWVAVGGLALLALFLKPALHGAFRADDTWNSLVRGDVQLSGTGLLETTWKGVEHYLSESGRPNVLGVAQGTFTSWIFESELPYHAYLIATTLLAAGVLYVLVRELGLSRGGALLVVTVLAGAIQLRSYHDAMLGYSGTIQFVLALTLGSLLLFIRGLRRGDTRLLVLSFLLFLPCPLLYEGTYTMVALYVGVALLERRGWSALRPCLPFLALGVGFTLISYIARASAPSVVPGYEVGGSPLAALRTYLLQLFVPLPGSSLIFGSDYGAFLPIGSHPTKAELFAGAWRGVAVFGLVLVLALRLTGRDGSKLPPARTLWSLAVIGGLLWVTSIVIISFAPKYQGELIAGRGHLPALIQVFGWALVATAVLLAVLRSAARRSTAAVRLVAVGAAGLLAVGAGFVGYNNMRVIGLETPIRETRDLLERSAAAGVFADMPEEASLIFSNRDLAWPTGRWNQVPDALESALIRQTDRRLDGRLVPPPDEFECPPSGSFPPADCEPLNTAGAWVRVRARPGGGTVILGRLPAGSSAHAFTAPTRDLRVFVLGGGRPLVIGQTTAGRPWNGNRLRWRRVDEGDGWAIYGTRVARGPLPVASSLDAADGRFDFTALGPPDQIVRIYGASYLLP
jgi:hypothetical protein